MAVSGRRSGTKNGFTTNPCTSRNEREVPGPSNSRKADVPVAALPLGHAALRAARPPSDPGLALNGWTIADIALLVLEFVADYAIRAAALGLETMCAITEQVKAAGCPSSRFLRHPSSVSPGAI